MIRKGSPFYGIVLDINSLCCLKIIALCMSKSDAGTQAFFRKGTGHSAYFYCKCDTDFTFKCDT